MSDAGRSEERNLDGDVLVRGVRSLAEALEVIGRKGVGVALTYVHPIVDRSLALRDERDASRPSRFSYVHVYMADGRGMEVGYWTPCVSTLFVFGVPRAVSEEMVRGVVYL